MSKSDKANIQNKLVELQTTFQSQLPDKIAAIDAAWAAFSQNTTDTSSLSELHLLVHSLAGAGGTFGAMMVSASAKVLEEQVKQQKSKIEMDDSIIRSHQVEIYDALIQLRRAATSWKPSVIPYIKPMIPQEVRESDLIFLAEDDELLAADLIEKLSRNNYEVRHFSELSVFEEAIEIESPAVIIMDIVFKQGDVAGTDVICRIKEKVDYCPPVIFISTRDDIDARLAAARAGASRYFCKPIDTRKLLHTIDGLTARVTTKPYRVLLVDDDETLLDYYAVVLEEEGMIVKTVSDSLKGLEELSNFSPDIIVLDVYMPGCSGPELAQVIRQDDAWALTPIMFLSAETDLSRQFAAMNIGGDDFLVKPVDANHLVAAVTARAKRARWTSRLNKDLLNTLRENEYQLITMDQHDIVSVADTFGRIVNANDKFCEISGYSRGELIGQNHRLLKSDAHDDNFYTELWSTISEGKIWHGTICNRSKNGEHYWVESTIVPFLDEQGQPYKYVSARTDITSRVQAEIDMRESEERFSFAVAGAGDGVWDWDMSSNEVQYSDTWMSMLGYESDELDGNFDTFANLVHPDDMPYVQQELQKYLSGENPKYSVELRMLCKKGGYKWVLSRGRLISHDNDGKPIRMTGIHSDITKRKHAEQGLIDALGDAEKANHAKSQFLSSMSHELRTPMNAIMGFGQLLNMDVEDPLTESQQANVAEILKAGDHLLELINEVLDLAKIESGRIDLSLEAVVLGEVIAESIQLIRPLAEKRGINIKIFANGSDISFKELLQKDKTVWVDRTRLKQVLLNLLSNAIKYNSENGVLSLEYADTSNNQTRISVTDCGEGLDKEEQSELFKAFNRLGADETNVEGTGIGLVITKNIVELMGGSIGVKSARGEGSTFWINVPNDTSGQVSSSEDPKRQVKTKNKKLISEGGPSVLYVEDNPANLRLVGQVLARIDNLKMWSAHEPLLGLELAMEHKPDLILLDINLPGMSGFEVLEKLRQNKATCNIPVIAISANAMPVDIKKGLNAGFVEYITKPVDIDALQRTVKLNLMKNGLKKDNKL